MVNREKTALAVVDARQSRRGDPGSYGLGQVMENQGSSMSKVFEQLLDQPSKPRRFNALSLASSYGSTEYSLRGADTILQSPKELPLHSQSRCKLQGSYKKIRQIEGDLW